MRLRRSSKPSPDRKRPGIAETFRVAWKSPRARRSSGAGGGADAARPGTAPAGDKGRAKHGAGALGRPVGEPNLLRQREELARQFAELQWDLGGIAYEMATRKEFKGEVLLKQAEKLREVDAKLGQIERVLRLGKEGAAGTCPNCGALQARGAVFCWKCGKEVRSTAKGAEAKTSGNAKPAAEKAGDQGAKPAAEKTGDAAKPAAGKSGEAEKPESK